MEKSEIKRIEKINLPHLNLGWLSLADHFVATVGRHSGQGQAFKNLLVLADAVFQPQTRFPKHPHRDMEILTWVAQGTLQHYDDNGTDQAVPECSLQLMSAGTGIFHAEGNATYQQVRMLQIWIQPNSLGAAPIVDQVELQGKGFQLLAGPTKAPLIIKQEAWFYVAKIENEEVSLQIPPGKIGYGLSIGELSWNGVKFSDGDGIIVESGLIRVQGKGQAIIILQNFN